MTVETIRHADLLALLDYMEANGLEIAGPMEDRPDPEHPGRLIPFIPLRRRKEERQPTEPPTD